MEHAFEGDPKKKKKKEQMKLKMNRGNDNTGNEKKRTKYRPATEYKGK